MVPGGCSLLHIQVGILHLQSSSTASSVSIAWVLASHGLPTKRIVNRLQWDCLIRVTSWLNYHQQTARRVTEFVHDPELPTCILLTHRTALLLQRRSSNASVNTKTMRVLKLSRIFRGSTLPIKKKKSHQVCNSDKRRSLLCLRFSLTRFLHWKCELRDRWRCITSTVVKWLWRRSTGHQSKIQDNSCSPVLGSQFCENWLENFV